MKQKKKKQQAFYEIVITATIKTPPGIFIRRTPQVKTDRFLPKIQFQNNNPLVTVTKEPETKRGEKTGKDI
jgi:hypothetical protein